MKRIVTFLLVLILSFSTILTVGCANSGIDIDENRTQLYVGVLENGFGRDWFDEMVAEYETLHPDVQIVPDFDGDKYTSKNILSTIDFDTTDVYLTGSLSIRDYVSINDATSEKIADISDIVIDGGEKSIYNRLLPEFKDVLNVGTESAPKFFVLPWTVSYYGLVYDKDLFELKNFYTIEDYTGLDGIDGTDDDLWGMDGVEGTVDDGLPATWEDMKILLDVMVEKEVIPFTWTGAFADYRANYMQTIIGAYEGKNNYRLRGTLEGTTTEGQAITANNAYLLTNQTGIKAMLTVAKHIASNPAYYHKESFNTMNEQTTAQYNYLASKRQLNGAKPIAFLAEATWWEQEAKNQFAALEQDYGADYAYGVRRLGFMPFPKFLNGSDIEDQKHSKTIISGNINYETSAIFINKKTPQLELAKDFVKFFLSEANTAKFFSISSNPVPYKVSLSQEQIKNMTTYAQDVYAYLNSEYVDVVQGIVAADSTYANNYTFFQGKWRLQGLSSEGRTLSDPLKAFAYYPDLTVEEYWNVYKDTYSAEKWATQFS